MLPPEAAARISSVSQACSLQAAGPSWTNGRRKAVFVYNWEPCHCPFVSAGPAAEAHRSEQCSTSMTKLRGRTADARTCGAVQELLGGGVRSAIWAVGRPIDRQVCVEALRNQDKHWCDQESWHGTRQPCDLRCCSHVLTAKLVWISTCSLSSAKPKMISISYLQAHGQSDGIEAQQLDATQDGDEVKRHRCGPHPQAVW